MPFGSGAGGGPPVNSGGNGLGLGGLGGSGIGGINFGMSGESPNETLRTFEIPKLPHDATPLEFGDGWTMLDSQMGDLSYSSITWWNMLKSAAEKCYQEWLNADPIANLRLKPTVDPKASMWPRTERRALGLLLQALPGGLKGELIANRKLSVDQILFRLLIAYQPGGPNERTKILQGITDGRCGQTV